MSTQDLVERLDSSRSTVRRTLAALEEAGLIRMVHGGATLAHGKERAGSLAAPPDPVEMLKEKRRIAAAAARLIKPGDTIFVDTGSTTHQLLPHLRNIPGLTVLTNDIHIAHELVNNPNVSVVLTGGNLGTGTPYCLVGPVAEHTIGLFVANLCIIGAAGIDPLRGITDPFQEVALVKKAMVRQATKVVLVVDHTKLGQIHKALVVPAQAIHHLITDAGANPQQLARLRATTIDISLC